MRFHGRDIFTERVPRSGISYNSELEFRMAAAWANYQWHEFQELDGEEQSGIIASYRANNVIEAVLATDESKKARRGSKRNASV